MSCLKEMQPNEPAVFPINLELELGNPLNKEKNTYGVSVITQKTNLYVMGNRYI